MKKVHVLGPGCAKCVKLAENTQAAIALLGLEYEIAKVTDIAEIMRFGVMATPALVVDGQVKAMGRVPSIEEIKAMLS